MPMPLRFCSTAAVHDAGGAATDTTRARGTRNAPPLPLPLPSSATGSIVTPAPPSRRHCRSKCARLAPAGEMARHRPR